MTAEALPEPITERLADSIRPFSDLRPTGLLWLINVSVFHPRGYALAIHCDDEGYALGWSLIGDGTESWYMGEQPEDDRPDGYMTNDDLFLAAKAMMP